MADKKDKKTTDKAPKPAEPRIPNAWSVRLGESAQLHRYSVTVPGDASDYQAIGEGDGFLIIDNEDNRPVAFARNFRTRSSLDETTFYFDSVIPIAHSVDPSSLKITLFSSAPVSRLDWSAYTDDLKTAAGIEFDAMPTLRGDNPSEQAYLRELLELAVMDDILGPANGPFEEIVDMSVRDRYLVGKFAPQGERIEADQVEELRGTTGKVDPEEGPREIDPSTSQSLVPSSFGITFCVDGDAEAIEVEARWGRYVSPCTPHR